MPRRCLSASTARPMPSARPAGTVISAKLERDAERSAGTRCSGTRRRTGASRSCGSARRWRRSAGGRATPPARAGRRRTRRGSTSDGASISDRRAATSPRAGASRRRSAASRRSRRTGGGAAPGRSTRRPRCPPAGRAPRSAGRRRRHAPASRRRSQVTSVSWPSCSTSATVRDAARRVGSSADVLGADADDRVAAARPRPAGRMFIGGVPMNWATNTVAGPAYTSCGVPTCSSRPRAHHRDRACPSSSPRPGRG